jgi:hypothetical protein
VVADRAMILHANLKKQRHRAQKKIESPEIHRDWGFPLQASKKNLVDYLSEFSRL